MSHGYIIPVDPTEIATRFSGEEDEEAPEGEEVITIASLNYETQVKPLLDKIPDREADLIYLYYIQKKRQADIAAIFGVTQAAISYRLDRGLQRIRFLLSVPQLEEEDMRKDLPDVPFKPIDVDILVGMWQTTCQSEVAIRLKLTQGRVRHRFFRAVKTLETASQKDKRFEPYFKAFSKIANKGFNSLHEVKLPQWQGRGGDGCF